MAMISLPGAIPEDLKMITNFLDSKGVVYKLIKEYGRPRVDVPFQNVLRAYRKTNSVSGAARLSGVSSGTVWRRLNAAGLLKKKEVY